MLALAPAAVAGPGQPGPQRQEYSRRWQLSALTPPSRWGLRRALLVTTALVLLLLVANTALRASSAIGL